jgi:hypothetical protein
MAVEKNPFDRIEQNNIIEIGIGPESTEIETGPVNMEFDDEGGVVIEFGNSDEGPDEIPEYAMDDEEGFFKNLVDDLDEDILEEISNQVLDNYEADKESRAEWESMFERGFDLLGLKIEEAHLKVPVLQSIP